MYLIGPFVFLSDNKQALAATSVTHCEQSVGSIVTSVVQLSRYGCFLATPNG